MSAKAFICGCEGLGLTADESAFFRDGQPWGLILFRRNVGDPGQVSRLCDQFREAVGRADAPVLVDQEGGRVQRLRPPLWRNSPAAGRFEPLGAQAERAAFLAYRLIAHDLRAVGITVDCAPVLDLRFPGAHDIVGDRAFSGDPDRTAILARAAAEALLAGGVLPVIKHLPGHGRAAADSHLELPIVQATRRSLEDWDFQPFRTLADLPIGMTAHVMYEALDPAGPATMSARVVGDVIRRDIGFDNLLLSDDLSMKALSGGLGERASAALAAGVDIALHCNGDLSEAQAVAGAAPPLEGRAAERAVAALARIAGPVSAFDPVDGAAELDRLLAVAGERAHASV